MSDNTLMKSVSFSIGKKPTELRGAKTKGDLRLSSSITGADNDRSIDANIWLPRAAEHYHISPKLSDYIMVPVPSVFSDLPNTNGDSVTRDELLKFRPDLGQLAYKTWVGKPTHVEHDNKDITKAKGVIFDCFLRAMPTFMGGHFKVIKLLGFDRTKDPVLCDAILSGKVNTYSLGMYFNSYECSICGVEVGQNRGRPCVHTRPRQKTYKMADGRLAYRKCKHITGFETSCVVDPAYVLATSDTILDPGKM
jgi:hypothetical protein